MFPDSAGFSIEIYVRIPPSALLASRAQDTTGLRELALEVRLRSPGGQIRTHPELVQASPTDTALGFGRVAAYRFPTRPGTQHVRVRLEDLHSRKQGLIYAGREVTVITRDRGRHPVAQAADESRSVGRRIHLGRGRVPSRRVCSGAIRCGFLPNPKRLYGLYAPRSALLLHRAFADRQRVELGGARARIREGRMVLEKSGAGPASTMLRVHGAYRRLDAAGRRLRSRGQGLAGG